MARIATGLLVAVTYPLLLLGMLLLGLVGFAADWLAGACSRGALAVQGFAMRCRRYWA